MELFFQWIVVICLPLITVLLIAIWNMADSGIDRRVLREIRDELIKKNEHDEKLYWENK